MRIQPWQHWSAVPIICISVLSLMSAGECAPVWAAENYLIGCAKADITGPPAGVMLWGFVRQDQISEGIHTRLFARAFVIAEPNGGKRVAFVCADLGSVTHELHREVVERLERQFGGLYSLDNVIISATHTHSGPGGYWHYGANSPLGGGFHAEHFEVLAGGITAAVAAAHAALEPGKILVNEGDLFDAGAQRSLPAYMQNPAEEREQYPANTDTLMTLLRFAGRSGDVGSLNWFAVHPTSMTYHNKLISGDHKGYAEQAFEKRLANRAPGFIAAFAQSNCGDVTPNLNLNNTGPGTDEFDSTRIIGERQLLQAVELFDAATEEIQGAIDYRRIHLDLSTLIVRDEFTHAGDQHTCPSAYGYAFAAGSTEDGGGHPLFKEGMKERIPAIDTLAEQLFRDAMPSDGLRKCQQPKAVLFAPGEMKPQPGQSQIVSIAIVRIGSLVLVTGPAEFTTMAGRRIRKTVGESLGESAKHVVIAGYSNGYAGYVTTQEEYQAQQYEGGHTLFGPWTLAGYQQEYARLAKALRDGQPVDAGPEPIDVRKDVKSKPIGPEFDPAPQDGAFGDVVLAPEPSYDQGMTVEAAFRSGHPRHEFHTDRTFLEVQRKIGEEWKTVATDADWDTKCRWRRAAIPRKGLEFHVAWSVPSAAETGTYRIVHRGVFRCEGDAVLKSFQATSPEFVIR